MKYIILDLEATCWEKKPKDKQTEIIEIGALAIDTKGEIQGEFNAFIRPKLHPVLSPFCTQLTSITQDQIDQADLFPAIIQDFWKWISIDEGDYFLCSWGFYDKTQFEKDCKLHELQTDWLQNHMSIKHQHQKVKGLKKPLGMASALKLEGFELDGTHHRGIDDARNISKIFVKHLGKWSFRGNF